MMWHEIVNDTVKGVPVAITYCPLCGSAVAMDRRLDDMVLSFGTSGLLHKSDLVMYDRQTESLWPQLGFRAAIGHLAGKKPALLPVSVMPWSEFRAEHPQSWVLSRDTGHSRNYGANPYVGYDSGGSDKPFLFDEQLDGRLPAKTHVIGLFPATRPTGITVDHLLKNGPTEVQGPDGEVVVWARPGVRSLLDADNTAEGRKTGSAVAYRLVTNEGAKVAIVADETGKEPFKDSHTGSEFNYSGQAVSGKLSGQHLQQVPTTDTFWFAWAAFSPETQLVQ